MDNAGNWGWNINGDEKIPGGQNQSGIGIINKGLLIAGFHMFCSVILNETKEIIVGKCKINKISYPSPTTTHLIACILTLKRHNNC